MRTTYRPRCVRRERPPDVTAAWARAFIARPAHSPADRRHQLIVADLLAQIGGAR